MNVKSSKRLSSLDEEGQEPIVKAKWSSKFATRSLLSSATRRPLLNKLGPWAGERMPPMLQKYVYLSQTQCTNIVRNITSSVALDASRAHLSRLLPCLFNVMIKWQA